MKGLKSFAKLNPATNRITALAKFPAPKATGLCLAIMCSRSMDSQYKIHMLADPAKSSDTHARLCRVSLGEIVHARLSLGLMLKACGTGSELVIGSTAIKPDLSPHLPV